MIPPNLPAARRRHRPFAAAAATLLAGTALVLTGCASPGPSESEGPADYGAINVQLSWLKNTEFVGEYLAVEDGFFEDNGFSEVTLTSGGSSATSAEAAVSTGQAFVGIGSPLISGPAILDGAEIKIVGATYQKNPFNITSLTSNPIDTPDDLAGKTIGVSDSNTLVFNAFLAANDIDPSTFTVVPFSDISQLTTGQVDGYLGYTTSGPYALELQGFEAQEFLLADYGLTMVGEAIIASDDAIENEPEKVKAFLYSIILGWYAGLADPERSTDVTVNDYGKDQEYDYDQQLNAFNVQAGLIVTPDTEENGILTMTDQIMADTIATLALCDIAVEESDLFDTSLIQEVYEEHPELLE